MSKDIISTISKLQDRLSTSQKVALTSLATFLLCLPFLTWILAKNVKLTAYARTPVTPVTPVTPSTPPSPTLTPTPTPTPSIKNHTPVVTTSFVKNARVGKPYVAYIRGYDIDIKDELTMKVHNLPNGLIQETCYQYKTPKKLISKAKTKIICKIEGTPTKAGLYELKVELTDNHGASTIKEVWLLVLNKQWKLSKKHHNK